MKPGEQLRRWRRESKITLGAAAAAIGKSAAYICDIEKDRKPIPLEGRLMTLINLYGSKGTDVSIDRIHELKMLSSKMELDVKGAGYHQRDMLLSLARNINNLTAEDCARIQTEYGTNP